MVRAGLALILALIAGPALADITPPNQDPAAAPAGTYAADKRHVSVVAKVSHMGMSDYTMRFDRVDAQFAFDPAQPEASKITVTIDAASLDVGEDKLDKQFANEFLGAEAHPQITFVSTAIQRTDATHGTVTGDLTLDGVTQPVSLAVTFNGYGSSLIGGRRMGFSATGDLKRSDFGSKAWLSLVGDQVHLIIEAEFTHQ
ncbi:MAG TPA: YceI family protein [Caulobacteraceae bacterium]|jgi:polyisoprenoid-binding protein YceI